MRKANDQKSVNQNENNSAENNTEMIGRLYYTTFKKAISRQERISLQREIENIYGLTIHLVNGTGIVFFVPQKMEQHVENVANWILENNGSFKIQDVTMNDENKKFVVKNVVEFMTNRLVELHKQKNAAMAFAIRTTKFKNTTKEYLRLRKFAEFYSHELHFKINRLVSEIDGGVAQIQNYLMEFH